VTMERDEISIMIGMLKGHVATAREREGDDSPAVAALESVIADLKAGRSPFRDRSET
jgi:hypothetical protein